MNKTELKELARIILDDIQKYDRKNINSYYKLAAQVSTLLEQNILKNKEEILDMNSLSHTRLRGNWQWNKFVRILRDKIPPDADQDTLLQIFGYLSWLLSADAPKKRDNRPTTQPKPARSQTKPGRPAKTDYKKSPGRK